MTTTPEEHCRKIIASMESTCQGTKIWDTRLPEEEFTIVRGLMNTDPSAMSDICGYFGIFGTAYYVCRKFGGCQSSFDEEGIRKAHELIENVDYLKDCCLGDPANCKYGGCRMSKMNKNGNGF